MEAAERQLGEAPQGLEVPPCPEDLLHLWVWFKELSAGRSSNGFGPNPISYGEMLAWVQLSGYRPTPDEVALLRMADGIYLSELLRDEGKEG